MERYCNDWPYEARRVRVIWPRLVRDHWRLVRWQSLMAGDSHEISSNLEGGGGVSKAAPESGGLPCWVLTNLLAPCSLETTLYSTPQCQLQVYHFWLLG